MKYLCLIWMDEKKLDALSEGERQRMIDDSLAYDGELLQRGHFLAAQALQPVRDATTVKLRNGKPLITDGPFAETNEQIGGFVLIEAADLDAALQIASHLPPLRLGAVEIRPIQELISSK